MRVPLGRTTASALVGLLLAAGCGSSSSGKSTTEDAASARTDWANDVCGALVTWRSDVKSVGNQLKNGEIRSKSALQSAANQVEDATNTLVDSLKGLGEPPTPGADQAKSEVDQLGNTLSDGIDELKNETSNVSGVQGVVDAVSSASATVSTMAKETSSTLTELQSIDSKGSWQQAFSQAESCKSLKGS